MTHWQSLFSNGLETSLKILDIGISRDESVDDPEGCVFAIELAPGGLFRHLMLAFMVCNNIFPVNLRKLLRLASDYSVIIYQFVLAFVKDDSAFINNISAFGLAL